MNVKKARAIISLGATSKELDRDLDDAKKKVRSFGKEAKQLLLGGAGKLGGGILGALGTGFGIQAAGGISEVFADTMSFEKTLVRLQIASGKTSGEMAALRQRILDVSKATAISNQDILAGAQTYIDLTGDVAGAEAAMSAFARIAQASGASVSDVATATAALQQSMKLDPKDIEAAFSGLIVQGKAGAVSLKDFASEMSALAPRFAKFGGSGLEGIRDLGAAFQIARKGFGSASEAATGLEAMMGALSLNAAKFQKAGVKIFNKDPKTGVKTMRSFVDIVDAIGASKLMKDPTRLTQAWGSKEAAQAFDMLHKNRKELEAIYEAGKDVGAVTRDLNTFMNSPTGQLEQAIQNVKAALVEAFTPARIRAFADVVLGIVAAMERIAAAAKFILPETVEEEERRGVLARVESANKLPPVKRAAALDEMMQEFAEMQHEGHPGGRAGRMIEARSAAIDEFVRPLVESARAEARHTETLGDTTPWGAVAKREPGKPLPVDLDYKALGAAVGSALKGVFEDFRVKMDGTTVGKVVDNAPGQRRPGSR